MVSGKAPASDREQARHGREPGPGYRKSRQRTGGSLSLTPNQATASRLLLGGFLGSVGRGFGGVGSLGSGVGSSVSGFRRGGGSSVGRGGGSGVGGSGSGVGRLLGGVGGRFAGGGGGVGGSTTPDDTDGM